MSGKTCAACGGRMQSIGAFPLQKGQYGFLTGHWDNLMQGALNVRAFCCETCRKLEFYLADEEPDEAEGRIAQVECPYCGAMHDLDDAICPHCNRRLMEL